MDTKSQYLFLEMVYTLTVPDIYPDNYGYSALKILDTNYNFFDSQVYLYLKFSIRLYSQIYIRKS